MKKYLLLLVVGVAVTFSACRKIVQSPFDADEQAKIDDRTIQDYFLLNQIRDVTKDPSGLYYHIDTAGAGTHPTSSSRIVVSYTTSLMDDTEVESQPSYYFELANMDIAAWRTALPLIGVGGTITLYIPSGLALGEEGNGGKIPPNACLITHITLLGFTN